MDSEVDTKPFYIERAKQGRASCKKCKEKCFAGDMRIAKVVTNPFGSGKVKQWYHDKCLFETLFNQRAKVVRAVELDDIDGWDALSADDKKEMGATIDDWNERLLAKFGDKFTRKEVPTASAVPVKNDSPHRDNSFREFRRLVAEITNISSYLDKTAVCKKMFTHGTDGTGFKGDMHLWCRLLLPGVIKRIYNLQSKQLVKLFSRIFCVNQAVMLEHLEQGDVAETIYHYFENNEQCKPQSKSNLTLQDVDNYLEHLSKLTKEDDQVNYFKKIVSQCTGNDLKIVIRLIKHDLRMNAGAKHILDGVHADAYEAFQASRDLGSVLNRTTDTTVKATISVMTPVLPMLAEACKSVKQAMKKCPNGMFSEIKYDGERVQLHKHGQNFKYFSRSLKPVMGHKVKHFEDYIPQAFPHGKDLILDSEILMIDHDGKPLPFGSLGVHKREEFKDANVCLFVFDCIYYNGEVLMNKPIKERRRILQENMTEIPNRIVFSEMELVYEEEDLKKMIAKVLYLGLEGLVLKDLKSIYEPGKRHWLKVKKDYLCDGALADTADLVVVGAWYGTGRKGGLLSVFLMACYDSNSQKFYTVTKVNTGIDDSSLEQLQKELEMTKISCEISKVPDWLRCPKNMIPDFIAKNPKEQPVWEITGTEFTQNEAHNGQGISIRFPRVTRFRPDKNWETATKLVELQELYTKSKQNNDFSHLLDIKPVDCPVTSKYVKAQIEHFEEINKENKKRESDGDVPKKRKSDSDAEVSKKRRSNKHNDSKEASNKTVKAEDNPKPSNKTVKAEDNPKPSNIFEDVKLYLTMDQNQIKDKILRNFRLIGGDILSSDDYKTATHVLHSDSTIDSIPKEFPKYARHVTMDWLEASVVHKQLQDTRPYAVQWVPAHI